MKEIRPAATANERDWAKGLKQPEFEREFRRRNPNSDVIPDAKEWANQKPHEPRGIDAIKPESYVVGD